MKKLFSWIFCILSFVCITAALTVGVQALMTAVTATGSAAWLSVLYGNGGWLGLGVSAGVCAILVIAGALINSKLKVASYVMSPVFGIAAFGVLLYLTQWGGFVPTTAILPMIPSITMSNATILYVAAGVMGGGLLFSMISRLLSRAAKRKKESKKRQKDMEAHEAYVPTSRDTDLAIASSRAPKIERYVRDPWGNLIKEEDYNERVNSARNKRF